MKVGKKEPYGRIWPLVLNNCEKFAVTVRSLRDHFNMKRLDKSKTRNQRYQSKRVKISVKISNFLKTLHRDLKKVNVDPKRILKKDSLYRKRKEESSRNQKKAMERFEESKKRELQDESDTGDKSIVEGVVQKWLVFIHFIREKREQGREFRSEDLQEENSESEAR